MVFMSLNVKKKKINVLFDILKKVFNILKKVNFKD